MPIIINGTGTIEGLNAGGLPDATVTPSELTQPLTRLTARATTSGVDQGWTGIPSWAERIIVALNGVRISGTSGILVQLGTSTGYATVGYIGGSFQQDADLSSTSGFPIRIGLATDTVSGLVTICNVTGNVWSASHAVSRGTVSCAGGGSVSLSGTCDRVRLITLNGSDTFVAGSANVLYD